jgi:hypothetical protein
MPTDQIPRTERFNAEVIVTQPPIDGIQHYENHIITGLPLNWRVLGVFDYIGFDCRRFWSDATVTINGNVVNEYDHFDKLGIPAGSNAIIKIQFGEQYVEHVKLIEKIREEVRKYREVTHKTQRQADAAQKKINKQIAKRRKNYAYK